LGWRPRWVPGWVVCVWDGWVGRWGCGVVCVCVCGGGGGARAAGERCSAVEDSGGCGWLPRDEQGSCSWQALRSACKAASPHATHTCNRLLAS
jgi:hypothetical protein